MLETVDQQTANVIRRVIDWTHDFVATFAKKPIARRAKKRACNFDIVN